MFAFSLGSALAVFAAAIAVVAWLAVCRPRSEPTVPEPEEELPSWFYWFADAPMFMDDRLVSSFYDAVLRPGYRTTTISAELRHGRLRSRSTYGQPRNNRDCGCKDKSRER